MLIEQRLDQLGLRLPPPPRMPTGVVISFSWVRVLDRRVLVSGHGAQQSDGHPSGPFGRVPDEVSLEDAQESARKATLSILGSVRRAIGDLDKIRAWVTINGFVNAAPAYPQTTAALNACSDLVLEIFGRSIGEHARTAIGASSLPLNLPVVISAELQLK